MATEPTNPLVRVAESDTTLPVAGTPNKVVPVSSLLTTGYDKGNKMFAENINYVFDNLGEYTQFLLDRAQELQQAIDDLQSTYEDALVTAGDGLSGGGELSPTLELSLGTPSTLDGTTGNSLTSESHTHALNIATQAEAEGGTDNEALMTALRSREGVIAAFDQSLSQSGYVELPNGLKIQWGFIPNSGSPLIWTEAALPTPFTTSAFIVTGSLGVEPGGSTDNSDTAFRVSQSNPLTAIEYYVTGNINAELSYIAIGI